MSKLPNHVESRGKDGRNYYKQEFIARIVHEIRSQKTTVAAVMKNYPKISRSVIERWLHNNPTGKAPGKRGKNWETRLQDGTTEAPTSSALSLLEQARAIGAPVPTKAIATDRIREELELAIAFVRDEIDINAVKRVLGRQDDTKFMITTWLGRVFAGSIRSALLVPVPEQLAERASAIAQE